jgi:hypothetical protein
MSVNTLINGQLVKVAGVTNSSNESMQTDTMPEPSSAYSGLIYQYIGETTEEFTNGRFYKCEPDDGGSSGGDAEPLTVNQNGVYTAPTGIGYSPVTVSISPYNVDTSFLPNSTTSEIVASVVSNELTNPQELVSIPISSDASYVSLTEANSDVTAYAVVKNKADGEGILLCVPYANSNGNSPSFYSPASSYAVECTVYSGNTRVNDITCNDYHVYTLAINSTSKTVRYYIDGVYLMEKTFSNSGGIVAVGTGDMNGSTYISGRVSLQYMGVVSELESDETIIANHLVIMNKLGIEI